MVLNTEKSPQLTHVFHKLDSLTATRPGLAISMYGYNDWFIYQDYDLNWFFKYNTYIPSTFFYNKQSDKLLPWRNSTRRRMAQRWTKTTSRAWP